MENANSKNEHKEANCCALDDKTNVKHSDYNDHIHGDRDLHQSTFKKIPFPCVKCFHIFFSFSSIKRSGVLKL